MNQITKKQHYVPQCLLKGFSTDTNSCRTNVYDVSRNQTRINQSIEDVMHQNYFYDVNNKIEMHLANSIETPASRAIVEVRKGTRKDFHGDNNILLKFLMCQYFRTIGASESTLALMKSGLDQIVKQFCRLNEMEVPDPDSYKLVPDSAESKRSLHSMLALLGVIMSKGMENLRFHALFNKCQIDYILSDNPVTRYNWLYRETRDPRIGSYFINGIQFFLPLSKRVTLCLYDPKAYKYGARRRSYTEINSVDDIDWLNHLQARETESFLLYSKTRDENYVRRLVEKYKGKKIYSTQSEDLTPRIDDDGKLRTPFITYNSQRRLEWKPTFFHIRKKAKKRQRDILERDPSITYAMGLLLDDFWKTMKSNPDLTTE